MKTLILFLTLNLLFCQYTFAVDKVEINTATLEQLDKITGIGPAIGQKIIDGRPYLSIDDLLRIKGIGEKTLQKIKDQGLAYIEGQSVNPAPSPEPVKITEYPDNILITEIMPSPAGADETNEWIKLSNFNDFETDLANWQIRDTDGKITTYTFPENTKISANKFLMLTKPETKISLNNDTDGLELIKPDETIADSVRYEKAQLNKTYIRTKTGWQWSGNTIAKKPAEDSTKNIVISSNQAKIKESVKEIHTDFPIYSIAVFMAICSSITILFLKSKLDKSKLFS